MPTTNDLPDENDFVRFHWTAENGQRESARGIVTDASDDDPPGAGVEIAIAADEPGTNTRLHYSEGVHDGEAFAMVHRESPFGRGPVDLGDNADWEVLE